MAARFSREDINARLRAERTAGRAVYDALCGTGITAKMAAHGGADMITTHILAHFRMQGLSSMAGYLPIGDANAIALELCERSLLNVVSECPVIAGCYAWTRRVTCTSLWTAASPPVWTGS